ncbi:MAG: hypothetical protein ACRD0Z_12210 [Acidimicrobiales bacterium]
MSTPTRSCMPGGDRFELSPHHRWVPDGDLTAVTEFVERRPPVEDHAAVDEGEIGRQTMTRSLEKLGSLVAVLPCLTLGIAAGRLVVSLSPEPPLRASWTAGRTFPGGGRNRRVNRPTSVPRNHS